MHKMKKGMTSIEVCIILAIIAIVLMLIFGEKPAPPDPTLKFPVHNSCGQVVDVMDESVLLWVRKHPNCRIVAIYQNLIVYEGSPEAIPK